ncbi:hypothetical protein PHISCL_00154 [Aspergillus sclerotialis]|uniref:Uncharacterized protein n=1 Tax=Aspergillus sclerotialis TaxID=2070753 RepID=A0A3A2ZWN5_9EURO|nr:hypothetical protein PHISCL_00154 [Aspergillus sclerotialis]
MVPDPHAIPGKPDVFEACELTVCHKLATNADYYTSPIQRLATVKRRGLGDAANHLLSRSRPNARDPYLDPEVIQHLKPIQKHVNKKHTAIAQLRTIQMKTGEKFQECLIMLSYCAQEADMPKDRWKEELHRLKLLPVPQNQGIIMRQNDSINFAAFSLQCTRRSKTIEERLAVRTLNRISQS